MQNGLQHELQSSLFSPMNNLDRENAHKAWSTRESSNLHIFINVSMVPTCYKAMASCTFIKSSSTKSSRLVVPTEIVSSWC